MKKIQTNRTKAKEDLLCHIGVEVSIERDLNRLLTDGKKTRKKLWNERHSRKKRTFDPNSVVMLCFSKPINYAGEKMEKIGEYAAPVHRYSLLLLHCKRVLFSIARAFSMCVHPMKKKWTTYTHCQGITAINFGLRWSIAIFLSIFIACMRCLWWLMPLLHCAGTTWMSERVKVIIL